MTSCVAVVLVVYWLVQLFQNDVSRLRKKSNEICAYE